MKNFLLLLLVIILIAFMTSVRAHEMTPTHVEWKPSMFDGVMKAELELFNKRADTEFFEIGVFDESFSNVPFVSSYKLVRIRHLDHLKFDLFIRESDVNRAHYVCSRSKLIADTTSKSLISSRICSRFKK